MVASDRVIKLLCPGEAPLFRELLDCFAEAFEDRKTYLEAQPSDEYLNNLIASEATFPVVALSQGKVVGGLVAYELKKFEMHRSEFYIYDLAVAEPFRRRGIATALIGRLKEVARARGAYVIFVQADTGDDPAIALYTKLGAREDVLHFDIAVDLENK